MTLKMAAALFVCGVFLLSFLAGYDAAGPVFGDFYTVTGVLELPYAEISEPFMAYYDKAAKKSRIDFYNGVMKTFQRGDLTKYGQSYKIIPMTNYQVLNKVSCFMTNGTINATVIPQIALPDLTNFKKIKSEMMNSIPCDVWQNVTIIGDKFGRKKNVYTMWVKSQDQSPVKYEMMGYDSLFGSHYDRYYVNYETYDKKDKPDPKVFDLVKNMTCTGYPGPGIEEYVLSNPMSEYMSGYKDHIDFGFENFKKDYGKKYEGVREHEKRKHNFRHNLRFIHSKNRANLGYTLRTNHLADKSMNELKYLRGARYSKNNFADRTFHKSGLEAVKGMPDSMDWRLHGAVTPVKDQANCGSCWSFGTTGTIEGAYFMKTGNLVRLSQQELMDCSWGEGNNGCDGGEDFRSYHWIMKSGGLTTEEQYGRYLAIDAYCKQKNVTAVAKLKGYVNITSGDIDSLKQAVFKYGPISVGIDASHRSLSFYANGVYYEPKCGNTADDLDHAVLAVGYGVMNGEPYWLIKNSWSTYWGNDGYVLMSQKDNNCGVATAATFVELQ